jgi:sugar lactone lactonase YvrE
MAMRKVQSNGVPLNPTTLAARGAWPRIWRAAATAGICVALTSQTQAASSRTYTTDEDFDEGSLINLNHDAPFNDQLQLNAVTEPFPFINIACSDRGTIVRVDTETGEIIGEYFSAPTGMGRNPSRTTVDFAGSVWCGNRNESSEGMGSVVKVGLVIGGTRVNADGEPDPAGEYLAPPYQYNTCIDRDADQLIKTSLGLGDIRPWALEEDAEDECIQLYVRTTGTNVRAVAVDAENNVWVGGYTGNNDFDYIDGETGEILSTWSFPGCGGYGALVDGNGVLWSSNIGADNLLHYDVPGEVADCISTDSPYGLGIDNDGYVWNTNYCNDEVNRYAPDGTLDATYATGGRCSRGVAVTPTDNNVWIANSNSNTVSRMMIDGTLITTIGVGRTPTGVAVDAAGKVWVTNYDSDSAMRIDPNIGDGAVDLTVGLGAGAGPYNYSDMTGIVALGSTAPSGTWTVVSDSETEGAEYESVTWNSDVPEGTHMEVEVRAADSEAGLPGQPWLPAENGAPLEGIVGRYAEIRTTLGHESGVQESPVLYDLTIETAANCVVAELIPFQQTVPQGCCGEYAISLENTCCDAQIVDSWSAARHLSTGRIYDVLEPMTWALLPKSKLVTTYSSCVSPAAPIGGYVYTVYAGSYPDHVVSADSSWFNVTSPPRHGGCDGALADGDGAGGSRPVDAAWTTQLLESVVIEQPGANDCDE